MARIARNVLAAVTVIALAAAPAYSQHRGKGGGKRPAGDEQAAAQKKKKNDAAERDYKAAIERLPDKPYDPWHSVR